MESTRGPLPDPAGLLASAVEEVALAASEVEEVAEELRRRRDEVIDRDALLTEVLASVDDVVVVVDPVTSRVRGWSSGAERRFHRSAVDVVGRTVAAARLPGLPARLWRGAPGYRVAAVRAADRPDPTALVVTLAAADQDPADEDVRPGPSGRGGG